MRSLRSERERREMQEALQILILFRLTSFPAYLAAGRACMLVRLCGLPYRPTQLRSPVHTSPGPAPHCGQASTGHFTSEVRAKKGLIRRKFVIKCTGFADELSVPPAQRFLAQEHKGERLSLVGG